MKKLLAIFAMTAFSQIAFSFELTNCGNEQTKYQVDFNGDYAQVKQNEESVEFGNMDCGTPRIHGATILTCRSVGVADGGFYAAVIRGPNFPKDLSLKLFENSFVGSSLIETLPCYVKD